MSGSPRPVVTPLTDFSTSDEYVGVMKGAVLNRCSDVALVDISHEVSPVGTEIRLAAGRD
jgi:S-adenosylmethionine hydrolase